jgi:homoserine kinase
MDHDVIAAVDVPASSANLGPGFDALAAAVAIHLQVRATRFEGVRVATEGEGAGELATDEGNLVWRALEAYCAWAGADVPDVALSATNAIPLERGLGSSAAAAVAGVALGRALTGAGGADRDLITLAADLEGHPDNAAAALLGGVVLCEGDRITRFEPTPALRPVLCVPPGRQSTEAARGLLPEALSHCDAAANGARTAGVLVGLLGLMPLVAPTMTDVLHEPARFAAMPGSGRLVAALRGAGIPASLSGAGPSVLAVVPAGDDTRTERVVAVAGAGWDVRAVCWDLAGALSRRAPSTPHR